MKQLSSLSFGRKTLVVGLPLVIIVLIDQYTKHLASSALESGPLSLIPAVLQLKLSHNNSLAFGLFFNKWLIAGLIMIALILLIATYVTSFSQKTMLSLVALGMILGGAVGNIIDRIRVGHVVDFIDIVFWSIFNVADIAIVAGLIILLVESFISSPNIQEKK